MPLLCVRGRYREVFRTWICARPSTHSGPTPSLWGYLWVDLTVQSFFRHPVAPARPDEVSVV